VIWGVIPKMKVRKREEKALYTNHLQRGGLTIYRGERQRGGRFSLRFLGPIGKFVGKTAVKLGKSIFKKVAPKVAEAAIETGQDVISGKTSLKSALKKGVKKGRSELAASTRQALLEELQGLERKQKGRGGLMRKRTFPDKYSW